MADVNIVCVSKSKLYPAFGKAYENPPRIEIRKDLPGVVKKFVLAHERYHILDWQRLTEENKRYNWIWGEIKANAYGAVKHPVGFLMCAVMSLHFSRLKFYFGRFRKGE